MSRETSQKPKPESNFERYIGGVMMGPNLSHRANFFCSDPNKERRVAITGRDTGKVSNPYGDECDSVKPPRLNSRL